jgi:hypothetical protein
MLPEALEVMKAWGFEYKSNMAWVKPILRALVSFERPKNLDRAGHQGPVSRSQRFWRSYHSSARRFGCDLETNGP